MRDKTFKCIVAFGVLCDIVYLAIGVICSNFMMMQTEAIGYWTYNSLWAASGIMLVSGIFGLLLLAALLYCIYKRER